MWNYDVSAAPRGHVVIERRKMGKVECDVEVFKHAPVIIATACGKVSKSCWLPPVENDRHDTKKQGRWEGMHYGEQPLAWQPWPKHPNVTP